MLTQVINRRLKQAGFEIGLKQAQGFNGSAVTRERPVSKDCIIFGYPSVQQLCTVRATTSYLMLLAEPSRSVDLSSYCHYTIANLCLMIMSQLVPSELLMKSHQDRLLGTDQARGFHAKRMNKAISLLDAPCCQTYQPMPTSSLHRLAGAITSCISETCPFIITANQAIPPSRWARGCSFLA